MGWRTTSAAVNRHIEIPSIPSSRCTASLRPDAGGTLVEHHWNGDSLACTLGAYGQQVTGRLDIAQDKVRVEIDVPFFLAIFADKLRAKLEREAPKLLEGDAPSPPAA